MIDWYVDVSRDGWMNVVDEYKNGQRFQADFRENKKTAAPDYVPDILCGAHRICTTYAYLHREDLESSGCTLTRLVGYAKHGYEGDTRRFSLVGE